MPSASSDHCPLRPGGTDRPGRAQALCALPGPPRSRWPRVRHRPLADRLSPARGAAGPSGAGAPSRLSSRTQQGLRKEARAGGTSAAADSGLTPTSGDGGVQTPRSRRRCPSHPLACRSRRGLPLGPSWSWGGRRVSFSPLAAGFLRARSPPFVCFVWVSSRGHRGLALGSTLRDARAVPRPAREPLPAAPKGLGGAGAPRGAPAPPRREQALSGHRQVQPLPLAPGAGGPRPLGRRSR